MKYCAMPPCFICVVHDQGVDEASSGLHPCQWHGAILGCSRCSHKIPKPSRQEGEKYHAGKKKGGAQNVCLRGLQTSSCQKAGNCPGPGAGRTTQERANRPRTGTRPEPGKERKYATQRGETIGRKQDARTKRAVPLSTFRWPILGGRRPFVSASIPKRASSLLKDSQHEVADVVEIRTDGRSNLLVCRA